MSRASKILLTCIALYLSCWLVVLKRINDTPVRAFTKVHNKITVKWVTQK